jgi:hypothetical protein
MRGPLVLTVSSVTQVDKKAYPMFETKVNDHTSNFLKTSRIDHEDVFSK